MKVQLYQFRDSGFLPLSNKRPLEKKIEPNLVLVFGQATALLTENLQSQLNHQFPNAITAICSTAGEILDTKVEDSLAITAIEFEKTPVKAHQVNIKDFETSREAGKALAGLFDKKDLSYVLILSDGMLVNGSDLVLGLNDVFGNKIKITGGLAGDADKFLNTKVGLNGVPSEGNIIAIGFYGTALTVGHGSDGGWDVFGPAKIITKSKGNILYEINNKNAYDLYVDYLGKYSDDLPGSALLFPLALQVENSDVPLVRTILSVDKVNKTMTFAGDMPENTSVRFMTANFDSLIDAAGKAAKYAQTALAKPVDFALLISCVGRRIVLEKRIEEEIEVVSSVFKNEVPMSGFYSYGELSPLQGESECRLHNQTMTITTFSES
jgi:hypothetical protein